AKAGHEIGRSYCPAQQDGGEPQRLIPRLVTELVVQQLEMIEVDEHQGAREALALQPFDVAVQFLEEGAAIEQSGERVSAGLTSHLALDRIVFENDADD